MQIGSQRNRARIRYCAWYHTPNWRDSCSPDPRHTRVWKGPNTVWLVGSAAAGVPHPRDVDLVFDGEPPSKEQWEHKWKEPVIRRLREILTPAQIQWLERLRPFEESLELHGAGATLGWPTFDPEEPTIFLFGSRDIKLSRPIMVTFAAAIRYWLRHGRWPRWLPRDGTMPPGKDFPAAITAAYDEGKADTLRETLRPVWDQLMLGIPTRFPG